MPAWTCICIRQIRHVLYESLIELVKEKGFLQRIDDAVRRILKVKFELGLFENRYVSPKMINMVAKKVGIWR